MNSRTISVYACVKKVLARKKRLVLAMLICSVLFGLLAVKQYRSSQSANEGARAEYDILMEVYNTELQKYDNIIATNEENKTVLQKQYDAQRLYCEESIYMRLPDSGFYVGELQFIIKGASDLGGVVNGINTFLGSTEFRNDLAKNVNENAVFLKDIILYSNSSNNYMISVYHYDEAICRQLRDSIKKQLMMRMAKIKKTYGEFEFELNEEALGTRVDMSITNAQAGHWNNYRNYNTGLKDASNAVANAQQDKLKYINEKTPEDPGFVTSKDLVKKIIINVILGLVLGCVVLVIWEVLICLVRGVVYSSDYCDLLGLESHERLVSLADEKALLQNAEALVTDLKLTMNAKEYTKLFIALAQNTELSKKVADYLKEKISSDSLKVEVGDIVVPDNKDLEMLANADASILLLQNGAATYKAVDMFRKLTIRYRVNNIGYFEWINKDVKKVGKFVAK